MKGLQVWGLLLPNDGRDFQHVLYSVAYGDSVPMAADIKGLDTAELFLDFD